MGQLKVRFTVEHHNEQNSFTCLDELRQYSYSNSLLSRVTDFEVRIKRAAADEWLRKKLVALTHPFEISLIHKKADSTPSDLTQRA
ncbi:hypothetical protein [Paenibacillus protaetiae]|uniref:Uncharacterized protein n=1 Tax=Paenibacillus protaetiae TaxID=2509456 RepID=A0A4P6EQC8_9BACL|nr:hypothetical protein [Paenibacillus protaetiae]QAY65034.1 hypothetical protein ET464_00155 [Paenibacillus protaetiae]